MPSVLAALARARILRLPVLVHLALQAAASLGRG